MKSNLSNQVIEFLKDHDYIIKLSQNGFAIRKSKIDTWVMIGVAILICIPITIVMFKQNKLFVASMWILVASAASFLLKSVKTHYILKTEQSSKVLKNGHNTIVIKDIRSVELNSKYIANYTSAFKDTNEEYKISLIISTKDGQKHTILDFKSDYANPSMEMNLFKDYIKRVIEKKKALIKRNSLLSTS